MSVILDSKYSYSDSSDEEYLPGYISESDESSSEEEPFIEPEQAAGTYHLRSRVRKRSASETLATPEPPKKKARAAEKNEKPVDPSEIVGREQEMRWMMRLLSQPTPQNPILIGPPGIGKKSIIHKFSGALLEESCPVSLRGREVVQIDCKELLGNIESSEDGQYFLEVIRKIEKSHSKPIFFFHDIDDLATAEGSIRYIFQSFLQKSPSLIGTVSDVESSEKTRQTLHVLQRYNVKQIKVEEPTKEETEEIIQRQLNKTTLKIQPDAIRMAVNLAGRYEKEYPYPIKAINLVFETAAEVSMKGGKPKAVTEEDVAKLMAEKMRMPAQQLLTTDTTYLNAFYQRLREQIVGQDDAVEIVFQGIKRGKLGFRDRSKPWGVYLFVGPTGVGKTELAKSVARELQSHFIRYDMGEYQESHSLARLIGSPPGYVGYEEGGGMTNELRKHPHSVVLFDEMEKAHPDVANALLQVFDDGRLTDGQGHTVDCTEAIFIMTSNLGSKTVFSGRRKPAKTEEITDQIYSLIEEQWSPEFLGRITAVIPFQHLSNQDYPRVVDVHLKRLAEEVLNEHAMTLKWSDRVVSYLLEKHIGDMRTGIRGLCERVKIEVFDALADAKEEGNIGNGNRVVLEVQHNQLMVHTRKK